MKRKLIFIGCLCLGAATLLSSCAKNSKKKGKGDGVSAVTGWPMNDKRFGGYEVTDYPGQQTGKIIWLYHFA